MRVAMETEIEALRQKVSVLQLALGVDADYRRLGISWGLSSAEAVLFSLLVSRRVVTEDAYLAALPVSADRASWESVKVFVFRMRRKLAGRGVSIHNIHGYGYRMSDDGRALAARQAALLREYVGAPK